jgi:diguanylate cyclase (GGDEF)-like protein
LNERSVLAFRATNKSRVTKDAANEDPPSGRLSRPDPAAAVDLGQLEAQNRELRLTVERLERLVFVDELTGLANRRCFDTALETEIRRAARELQPLALILCDIDRFKRHNDRFGHRSGDVVLELIGGVLQGYCRRAGDCAARYGGEEFALILPQTRGEDARAIAEEIRGEVESLSLDTATGANSSRITISIGVTTFVSASICPTGSLVDAADRALYRAKNAGRNRTRFEPHAG